jgi:glycosyltransferase involved in cell wall biosynthesis
MVAAAGGRRPLRVVLSNASYKWGGVHVVTETLARGLTARGHHVAVFCRPDSALEERLRGVAALEPILRGMDLSPTALWRCARALRRHQPDVVLTLMDKDVRLTAPVARILGIPVVVRRANDRPLKSRPHFRLLYGTIPAHHVANSRATRDTILRSAPWLSPEAVTVIHNGIAAAPYQAAAPIDLGLPPGALAIGFIGRFEERKGLLDLARAWPTVAKALPYAHLVIAGKGPVEGDARAILTAEPRVRWLGFRTDVPNVLKALDILAVPSHWEGFGLIAAEGLAAGVPVVAADASSLPEIVDDGVEGLQVPPRDPDAMARALIGLARDPAARARMAAAGPERVRRDFSVERMLERYESVLENVVATAALTRHP